MQQRWGQSPAPAHHVDLDAACRGAREQRDPDEDGDLSERYHGADEVGRYTDPRLQLVLDLHVLLGGGSLGPATRVRQRRHNRRPKRPLTRPHKTIVSPASKPDTGRTAGSQARQRPAAFGRDLRAWYRSGNE